MSSPQNSDWSKVDNDYWTRQWGLRRIREDHKSHMSPPSSLTERVYVNDYYGAYTVTNLKSPGTLYGHWKRTLDQNNAVFMNGRIRHDSRYGDIGGPFMSESLSISPPTHISQYKQGSNMMGMDLVLDGYFHPSKDFPTWAKQIEDSTLQSPLVPMSDLALDAHGTTGIAQTIPTKPEMSLSTSIGELKDGLPSLIGKQMVKDKSLSSLGSEYLNYQFGIAPMVKDAKDVVRLTKQYENIVRQFRRDQGKIVRRRRTLVDTEESQTTRRNNQYAYAGGGEHDLQSFLVSDNNSFVDTSTYRSKVWFSGAYAIAYPKDADGLLQEIAEFNRVYGVIPNAELAWNLLPWSWLADWFGNLGDIIANVSYLTSPATKLSYGYVMHQSSYTRTQAGMFGANYQYVRDAFGRDIPIKSSFEHTYKRRIKASPFGFGVTFGSLTGKQSAILAALGLSRLRL